MQGRWSMVAVLLLVAMAAALPDPNALSFPVAPASQVHPAGCHDTAPATPVPATPAPRPSPAPASYECCVNGHHAAIPNASFSVRSMAARLCGIDACEPFQLSFAFNHLPINFVLPSSSPPGTAPLRI